VQARPFADVVNSSLRGGLPAEHRALLQSVREKYVSKDKPPASTLVGVQALARSDFLVEIEAVAVVGRIEMANGYGVETPATDRHCPTTFQLRLD